MSIECVGLPVCGSGFKNSKRLTASWYFIALIESILGWIQRLIVDPFKKYYQEKRFPAMLEVKSVAHSELGVICDVHLSDTQLKFIKLNNIKIYGWSKTRIKK